MHFRWEARDFSESLWYGVTPLSFLAIVEYHLILDAVFISCPLANYRLTA